MAGALSLTKAATPKLPTSSANGVRRTAVRTRRSYWHERQTRAIAGQTALAIELFEKSHQRPDLFGWNLYVDGSIAFLRRDRKALQAARDELAALPQPDDWPPLGPDGKPAKIAWPANLDFLNGFLRCWDLPYSAAYGCPKPK